MGIRSSSMDGFASADVTGENRRWWGLLFFYIPFFLFSCWLANQFIDYYFFFVLLFSVFLLCVYIYILFSCNCWISDILYITYRYNLKWLRRLYLAWKQAFYLGTVAFPLFIKFFLILCFYLSHFSFIFCIENEKSLKEHIKLKMLPFWKFVLLFY